MEYKDEKREEYFPAPTVIDYQGIKAGDRVVDILSNRAEIQKHILSRVIEQDPRFIGEAEKLLPGLIISMGSHPFRDVMGILATKKIKDMGIVGKPAVLLEELLIYSYELGGGGGATAGFFAYDDKRPILYINSGELISKPEESIIKTWDHEIYHFIESLDPSKRKDYTAELFKRAGVNFAVTAGVAIPASILFTAISTLVRKEKLSRREFFARAYRSAQLVTAINMIPMNSFSQSLYYQYFSPQEDRAHNHTRMYSTPQAEFDRMFQIKTSVSV